jgi:DNA replication and repair protein RecF
MHITHLSLTNFRNFSRLDLEIPSGALLFVGDNAQGKTSLLEAVYFLATFTSFHASSDRQLINFIALKEPTAVGRITADIFRGEKSHHFEVRIIKENNPVNGTSRVRKEILLDGVKRKASELMGQFNAVMLLPQMLRVIEGSPEERRRYLNLALAQVVPSYADSLTAYNRAINQRNALLKLLNERGGDPDQLTFWDEIIATRGAHLVHARTQAIHEIEHLAALIHHELTRGDEILRLVYQPAYDPLPKTPGQYALGLDAPIDRSSYTEGQIAEGFRKALLGLRPEEIARRQTTIGPHRDDLRFLSNGVDLGIYGSRGQVRTTMLALKMAEVTWMKSKTGYWPVLLLDEVLAELDPNRRTDLLERLVENKQALLTTTDLDLFTPAFLDKATQWRVHQGSVRTSD